MRALFDRRSGDILRYSIGDTADRPPAGQGSVNLPNGVSVSASKKTSDVSLALASVTYGLGELPAIWMRGHFLQRHSLAHVNRELAKPLLTRGLAVHLEMSTENAMPEHLALGHRFPQHEPFGKYFALQPEPWEPATAKQGSAIPCMWDMIDTYRAGNLIPLEVYHRHRLILTPSEYSRNALRERGVNNAFTVPNGVNGTVFRPDVPPIDLSYVLDKNEPSFRAWGAPWNGAKVVYLLTGFLQEKKNVAGMVRAWNAFWHAGNRDCVLIVKNSVGYWGKSAADIIEENNRGSSIVYTEKNLSDQEFAGLLARIDVLAQPSSIEGFGLIPLQAMSIGKPVVVTNFGGFTDFCTKENASLIEVYPSAPPPDFPGFPYCDFTTANGARALQHARDTMSDGMRQKARIATAKAFSWEYAADRLQQVLREHSDSPLRPMWRPAHRGLVSIIVTARGGQPSLDRLCASLQKYETWPYELIVVDDGSDPELRAPVGARIVRVSTVEGAASGRNRGFLQAQGEYILTLDTDIEIERPVLGALIDALGGPLERVVVAPKLIYGDRRIQSAGGSLELGKGGKANEIDHFVPKHRCFGEPEDSIEANVPVALQYAPSAAHFFGRALLEKIGVYWEEYEAALWEDTHFCYSLRQGGVSIRYVPSVTLIHNEGQYNRSMHPSRYWRNEELFRSYFPDAALPVSGATTRASGEEKN